VKNLRSLDSSGETLKETLSNNTASLISGLGNCNYLLDHILYFEKNLPTEIAPFESDSEALNLANWAYQNCHNFAAWIRLYPEFICNRAMASLSRSEDCKTKLTDYYFRNLVEKTFKKVRENYDDKKVSKDRLEEMIKALKLTIELRHTIQHGGLPSILRNKDRFTFKEIDLEEVAEMANPLKYQATKKIFADATELIGLLPQRIIVFMGDGSLKFEDPKESKIPDRPAKG
jgi:hypothetical protein